MLKIIYGKSGTGKSTELYNDIKENLSNEKIFLIVPEQSNLNVEQKLIDFLEVKSLMNVQVLTLSRMAYRIFEETGRLSTETLNGSGKAMIIYDILKKGEKNLKFLGKSDKNVDVVINMITELKKCCISEQDLDKVHLDDEYLNLKIDDIKLIYKEYNERIQNKFIDENDILNVVANRIKETNMFEGSRIYIDDFLGFTNQEYNVFEELLKKADDIIVTVPADNLELGDKETDTFYFNKAFANKMIDIAEKNSVKVEVVALEKNFRLKNDELKTLEKSFSSVKPITYDGETQNIKLFLANNSYSEMEYIANEILKLVKNENYKYNEIEIISDNIDEYGLNAKIIFDKYNIPIFIDEKKDLNQNILIRYVLSIFDIFTKNWSYEAVFNYLKTGLLDIPEEDIFELENYCKKWGIKYNKWFSEFKYEDANEKQEKLEELRKCIVQPLQEFKESLSKNKTAREITENLYNFLSKNNISSMLDKKIKEIDDVDISAEYNTSYKIFVNILDTIVSIFGEEEISFERYGNLLQIGFSTSELGRIPMSQDQIILGDSKRSRNSNIKVCFICGANDGYFPSQNKYEGFLNDDDRLTLRNNGIELAKTSLELLYENNFEIYNILSLAEDKIYLSYASSDRDGKGIRPSILIKKIKRIFPEIKEESDVITKDYNVTTEEATFDDAISVYKEFLDGKDISDEWKTVINYFKIFYKDKFEKVMQGEKYTNTAETISEENIKKLYGNNLMTSISRLEQYRRCPFSFHLKYGLNLKESPELKMQTIDTGTFMHEVIDEFFEVLDAQGLNVKEITEEEVSKIVQKIIDDTLDMSKYYIFRSTAKFRTLTNKLKSVVTDSVNYIVYALRNSEFECIGHEVEFNKNGKYKPIEVELSSGKKLELSGKIDRMDVGKLDDKTYVRIIDYKSSVRDIDLNQVYAGLQIQLITYLDAVTKQENLDPAGILYFNLTDNIYDGIKNEDDEKIKNEIQKQFKMNGYVLADLDVVRLMDKNLNVNATSDIIPVALNSSNGEFNQKKSKVLNEDEFEKLEAKVENVVKEIGDEIMKGRIDINPYSYKTKTGCDYCEYKTICLFNPNLKGNNYNYIRKEEV